MSDAAMDAPYCLRVMVNKEKTKVLFAEADSDFVSVLLSFLALPLGRIAKLLEKHYGDKAPAFGSISSLYKGLANLDDGFFSSNDAKLMLLHPSSSFDSSIFSSLKIDVFKHSTKYFVCGKITKCSYSKCICVYYGGFAQCNCEKPLSVEEFAGVSKSAEVAFIVETATFIISDDLKMVPNSASLFHTLDSFGVTVADGTELRNLTLGTNEIMDLLSCCLLSKTPLTDFVLNNGEINISSATKPNPGIFLHQTESKKIILKVMVHKITNKVLFAQAEDDFVELLFSFLMIPIGGVESLLDNNTYLNNLDNLYKSISDVNLDKYFTTLDTKKSLMNPNIPYSSKPKSTFLPLNYEKRLFRNRWDNSKITFKTTIGECNYVKQPSTYLVTDDLSVTPFHPSSAFSILNRLKIPLSDVDEREVHIGLQEALSILKASLTSNSALNNGLFNLLMKKQPKQEP